MKNKKTEKKLLTSQKNYANFTSEQRKAEKEKGGIQFDYIRSKRAFV